MAIKDVILGYAKGDKGDRGPQGEKGATGATGPKGDPGSIADAQITDTEGLDVAKGQKTTAQKLLDAIANRIVTKLVTNDALTKKLADYMLKGMMSNTNVNNTGTVPTSALMYSMFEQINSDLQSNWIPLKPYFVNGWEDNGASLYRKIGNCYLVKLSVRYGNYETDLDICRNLPFSGTGIGINCFYNSTEVGNAIQVSSDKLFIVRKPIMKIDAIFANFIVGPDV